MHLNSVNQLGKIFINEAHLFSTDRDFRPMFHQLPTLRFVPIPFVLMTATAPEWIVRDIVEGFFGPGRMPLVIRQQTNCFNIMYLTKISTTVEDVTSQSSINLTTYKKEERGIVYALAIDLVIRLKEAFSMEGIPCTTYSGQQMPARTGLILHHGDMERQKL